MALIQSLFRLFHREIKLHHKAIKQINNRKNQFLPLIKSNGRNCSMGNLNREKDIYKAFDLSKFIVFKHKILNILSILETSTLSLS